jgi:thiol-disulfide isomerase/thioredoxin
MRRLLTFLALGLLLGSSLAAASGAALYQSPDFTLKDLATGKPITLSHFKGKVVLLDFWATWCPPCRAEIPHLVQMNKELRPQGLRIIGISVDQNGPAVVKSFMKNYGINYPVLLATQDIAQAYGGISGIPTTFLLGRNGEILDHWVGYTDEQVFRDAIRTALAR